MTFSTRKSGIPPESSGIPPESSGISPGISGIPFFKFEFTFRSENAVFGGISSGIPFPVIGGIRKKNEKVNPGPIYILQFSYLFPPTRNDCNIIYCFKQCINMKLWNVSLVRSQRNARICTTNL